MGLRQSMHTGKYLILPLFIDNFLMSYGTSQLLHSDCLKSLFHKR